MQHIFVCIPGLDLLEVEQTSSGTRYRDLLWLRGIVCVDEGYLVHVVVIHNVLIDNLNLRGMVVIRDIDPVI